MYKRKNDTLIIIPVFNEEKNISHVVEDLRNNCAEIDIAVINDGSTDNTLDILKRYQIFVINHAFNMGIGASFQTGCLFALKKGYGYIVRVDGDGQHSANFISEVMKPVKNGEVDIAIGSRFLGNSEFTTSFFRLIGISIISCFLSALTKRKITDPTSGFCAMNKKAFEFFSENCIDDYPEPEILLYYKNFRIKEMPYSVIKRQSGISSITPLKSIYYMYKVLLSLFMSLFRRGAI